VWAQWCWPCGHSGVGRVGTVVLAVWAQWCWPCGHSGVGRVGTVVLALLSARVSTLFHSLVHTHLPSTHTHTHTHTHSYTNARSAIGVSTHHFNHRNQPELDTRTLENLNFLKCMSFLAKMRCFEKVWLKVVSFCPFHQS
jgi:hypothetical protein